MRIEMTIEWDVTNADGEKIEIANEMIEEAAGDWVRDLHARFEAAGLRDITVGTKREST